MPAALALTWGAAVASPARAQSTDKAGAERLFDQGRKLMDAKKFAEACEKFAASEKLEPAVGTMLNLADCSERSGHLATAWAYYREALALAESRSDAERGRFAGERARAIEPRLATLTIRAADRNVAGLEIRRDGAVVAAAALGTALPIDVGTHAIEATAPGRRPWSVRVEVPHDGAAVAVGVPALEPDEAPQAAPPVAATPLEPRREPDAVPPAAPSTPAPQASSTLGPVRWAAIATGGAGVVALGVGAGFALRAKSTWDGAQGHCNASNQCDDFGYAANQRAHSQAGAATGFVVGGAVALVAAGVLWIAAPRANDPGVAITVRGDPAGGAAVGVAGTF